MKRIKLLVVVFGALAVLGLVSLAAAATPVYDQVWFQMKIQAKGYAVDETTGAYARYNFPLPAYIQLQWDAANGWYNIIIWCKTDKTTQNQGWEKTGVSQGRPQPPGTGTENFMYFSDTWFYGTGGIGIDTTHIPFIIHKTDAHGALHATWKGTGMVFLGNYPISGQTKDYRGSFNISGKNVDPATLPFTP